MSGSGILLADAPASMRRGQCLPNCGACCVFVRLQVPPTYRDGDVRNWLGLHGISIQEIGGATFAVVGRPCSELTPDKRCGLYGKPERPRLCEEYPATPGALRGIEDVCGYSFGEPA